VVWENQESELEISRSHARSALTKDGSQGYVPRSLRLQADPQHPPGQAGKKKSRHKVLL